MAHEFKVYPAMFEALTAGELCHDVRPAADVEPLDEVIYREWSPINGTFTGRCAFAVVTYVTPAGTWGMPGNLRVFSIRLRSSSMRAPPANGALAQARSGTLRFGAVKADDDPPTRPEVPRCGSCAHTRILHKDGEHCCFCECGRFV